MFYFLIFSLLFLFVYSMSPERPPSSDGGPILESPNMVLSSIPIESGHVLQQHQQQRQQMPQQYHQNINHAITNGNYTYTTSPSSTTSSKLLVLQPNQLNDNYIASKLTFSIRHFFFLFWYGDHYSLRGMKKIRNVALSELVLN